jgi:hypothetical protein
LVNDAGEATVLLPLCTACHAQHHNARSSGRPNPKFDTGGRRATKQAEAAARVVRVADEKVATAAAAAAPEDATDVLADAAVAADEARIAMDSGGAAEAMDEDDAAVTFPEGAPLPPLAKDASPPRGRGARGSKSARAARENPDEVRNSGDKPTRRLPRAAAANNTAVEMIRAGGYSTAAATAAQRRRASGGSS